MTRFAVVKTGGKQYVAKENDILIVDRLPLKEKDAVELETLATFDDAGTIDLGAPVLEAKTQATVLEHLKGDKIRVAKFKAKVRYRKVNGFRAAMTKIQITKIA